MLQTRRHPRGKASTIACAGAGAGIGADVYVDVDTFAGSLSVSVSTTLLNTVGAASCCCAGSGCMSLPSSHALKSVSVSPVEARRLLALPSGAPPMSVIVSALASILSSEDDDEATDDESSVSSEEAEDTGLDEADESAEEERDRLVVDFAVAIVFVCSSQPVGGCTSHVATPPLPTVRTRRPSPPYC